VPTAVRGPVVGPACRACASGSERGWGRQEGASASFYRRGEPVRAAKKYLGRHCVRQPRFMARWSLPTDESQLIS
jgi:hypothetical protein